MQPSGHVSSMYHALPSLRQHGFIAGLDERLAITPCMRPSRPQPKLSRLAEDGVVRFTCYYKGLIRTAPTIVPQTAADAMPINIIAARRATESSSPSSST